MESIKDHLFKETIRLLRLSPDTRTPRDIATLMEATAEVGFFKQVSRDYSTDEVHRECVKCMTLRYYRSGHYIFNYGDAGDAFYIVLRGTISVQMPKSVLMAENFDFGEVEKLQERHELPPINKKDKKTDKRTAEAEEEQHKKQLETEAEQDVLYQVRVKGDGTAFGELALLTDQPRAASIQCIAESWIAKLKKEDFTRILKDYEERKLSEMVKFLKSLGVFQNWTRYSLVKITYLFETRRYKHNQLVYRCGDPADHVFIIKSGEFTFTYTIEEDEGIEKHARFRRTIPKKQLQMFIKGSTELFGDDDLIEGRTRSLTCVCSSLVGEVLVIEKNDFMRRLQVPNTWEYLSDRHQTEEKWKKKRIETLRMAELLKKRMVEAPRTIKTKEVNTNSARLGARMASTENYRSNSISPAPTKHSDMLPSKAASFFKTEVDDSFYSEEGYSLNPTNVKPNTPVEVKQGKVKYSEELPPRKTPFVLRFSTRASPRPPPNFFVNPADAVNSRYKFRHLITGRLEEAMSPVERSFHRKLSRKHRTRRMESVSEERKSIVPPIGFS
mmetsp:Transcript_5808/g.10342  ORF Transcript_5808/g.10342 Transcript_5808/m.10342 type:complete len:556 (-) Transcript_5808:24-1691(-)